MLPDVTVRAERSLWRALIVAASSEVPPLILSAVTEASTVSVTSTSSTDSVVVPILLIPVVPSPSAIDCTIESVVPPKVIDGSSFVPVTVISMFVVKFEPGVPSSISTSKVSVNISPSARYWMAELATV